MLAAFVALNLSLAGPGESDALQFLPRTLDAAVARIRGPVRIGLQVGHLEATAQPDELASLRTSTGAHAAGLNEVDVNEAIADALALRLRAHGYEVEVLPATIPIRYRADVVLSIHADASLDLERHGYKSAHFTPARNPREALLKLELDRAVLRSTSLADDDRNVSGNMLQYYAFNNRRFRHAVARRTPALLLEMGYLSNDDDRQVLMQPERMAKVLEAGVLRYLVEIGRIDRSALRD